MSVYCLVQRSFAISADIHMLCQPHQIMAVWEQHVIITQTY